MASRCKIWGQVVVIGVLCCSFKQAACKVDLPESVTAKVTREGPTGTVIQSTVNGHGSIKERAKGALESSAAKAWVALMEEGIFSRHRRSAVAVGLFRRRFEERMKAKEAAERDGNYQRYRGAAVLLAAARRRVAIGKRRHLYSGERKRRLEHERRISEDDEEGDNSFQEGNRESSGQGEVGEDEDAENSIYNERDRQPKEKSLYQPETDPVLGVSTADPVGEDRRKPTVKEAITTDTSQGVSTGTQQGVHGQQEGKAESEEPETVENEKREKQLQLEEERRRQLEEERRRQLDEERRRRLDEERRRQLDEERRRQLDEERRRQEARTSQTGRIGTVQVDVDGRRNQEEIRKLSPGSRGKFEEKRRQLEKQRGQNEEVMRILRLEEEARRQKLMKEKEDYYEKLRNIKNMEGTHGRDVRAGENLEKSENNTNAELNTVSTASPTPSTSARSQSQQQSEYEKLIRSRCTDCKIGNQTFRGHSRFSYEEDCHKYQCICHCDGTHDCPSQYKVSVCDQGLQKERENPVCNSCTVEGEIIEGNDMFELQDGCTLFRECKCFCNGTSYCSPDQTENTCASESQTGSEASGVDSKPNQVCQKCVIEGIEHPAESRFQYTRDCITTDCSCTCNGTIECDQSTSVNRCVSQQTPQPQLEIQVNSQNVKLQKCQQCLVAGRLIDGNSQFNAKVGCYIDTCFCLCNGRYSCIRNWARNICNDDTGFDDGQVDHRGVCRGCFLQGVHYPGNATFKFTTGCTALDCACTCSGSVECYEESAVNICGTRPPTVKPLFEVFTTHNVRAPGPRECKKCMINGTLYDGNTQFDLVNGCHTDRCRCLCNGNHTCRRYQARQGCNETESPPKKDLGPCQECLIQGRKYPGNSTFQTTNQCIVKDCRCSCSGSVECDDRTSVNICQTKSVKSLPTTPQPTHQEASCKKCVVDGVDYAGGSKFKVKRGCKVYPCHCPCDGRWGCRTDAAVDICNKTSSEPTVSRETCSRCVVQGRKYPGNSQFKLRKGCISFRCTCACDGSWNCPPEQARNYCPGSTQSTETTTAATVSPTEPLS